MKLKNGSKSSFKNTDKKKKAQNHVITIDQGVELMSTQMKQPPKLLLKLAGRNSCCIFRVPQSLVETVEFNQEAYRPRIVSIGPYHYGDKGLEMIQEHKWRYLDDLITRTGKSLKFFMDIMVSMEVQIRESYSESIDGFSKYELAKMMVLDGVFLIEFFRKVGRLAPIDHDDPIFRMGWVPVLLMKDLLKMENQIPFFVLQKLFNEINTDVGPTLPLLILVFFNCIAIRAPEVLQEYENLDGLHLLDLFRKSFINTKKRASGNRTRDDSYSFKRFQPATNLDIAGVKFKANLEAESFLDIEFKNGYLCIPEIGMNDMFSAFLLNCVAFEQCYFYCEKDFTAYVVFMGFLMNTSNDASLLSESKIIHNYFGTDADIASFLNHIRVELVWDPMNNYLTGLSMQVNDYCRKGRHLVWAEFRRTYFKSPWTFISAVAALVLLSLAAVQTFYTVFPYYRNH